MLLRRSTKYLGGVAYLDNSKARVLEVDYHIRGHRQDDGDEVQYIQTTPYRHVVASEQRSGKSQRAEHGLSVRKIARVLGYTSHIALNTYINKRGLHQVAKAWGIRSRRWFWRRSSKHVSDCWD